MCFPIKSHKEVPDLLLLFVDRLCCVHVWQNTCQPWLLARHPVLGRQDLGRQPPDWVLHLQPSLLHCSCLALTDNECFWHFSPRKCLCTAHPGHKAQLAACGNWQKEQEDCSEESEAWMLLLPRRAKGWWVVLELCTATNDHSPFHFSMEFYSGLPLLPQAPPTFKGSRVWALWTVFMWNWPFQPWTFFCNASSHPTPSIFSLSCNFTPTAFDRSYLSFCCIKFLTFFC